MNSYKAIIHITINITITQVKTYYTFSSPGSPMYPSITIHNPFTMGRDDLYPGFYGYDFLYSFTTDVDIFLKVW